MEKPVPRNELAAPLTKFCLAVEEHRRTSEGRVRTASEFLQHFFPYNEAGSNDLVFRYLPREIRGPILANWRIRGLKAALRDSDEKVESVIYDALTAGDIDADTFESGLSAEILIQWIPLASWWSLWRGGKLSKKALLKGFETAYALHLFDAKWFLDTIESRNGKLRGTDVIAEGLTKADLSEWVKRIHESGNGSPTGLIATIGWDKIVTQTPNDVLVAALDAFALRANLAIAPSPGSEASVSSPPAAYTSRAPTSSSSGVSSAPAASSSRGGTPSVPPTASSFPRSRKPEPALLSDDAIFAAVQEDDDAPPTPLTPAPSGAGGATSGKEEVITEGPTTEQQPDGSLRDRIDFIRRRLP